MRDLKIKPSMDTPKAKLKNPAPKDADSILKQHMDKRKSEKAPDSRDPVRYATDHVEQNMRRGAAFAADSSRRMIKHEREKRKENRKQNTPQSSDSVPREQFSVDASASGSTDAPLEYGDFTSARNEIGNTAASKQYSNRAEKPLAAPRERGRQKAAENAKAACRRNLAEKRTIDGSITLPQSDRGSAMPFSRLSVSDTTAKNGPAPKGRQTAFKVTHRTAHTLSSADAVHPMPNIAQYTRAAAQRKAQRKMLRESAQKGGKTVRKLGGAAVQAVKSIGKTAASAASSLLAADGGAVVLVLLLTVILVAAIVASPFGILFSNESREAGVVPISAAVAQVNYDFNAELEALQTAED